MFIKVQGIITFKVNSVLFKLQLQIDTYMDRSVRVQLIITNSVQGMQSMYKTNGKCFVVNGDLRTYMYQHLPILHLYAVAFKQHKCITSRLTQVK